LIIFNRIAECSVFFSGFDIMALVTGGAPVRLVPEEGRVSAVRDEVVDESGGANDLRFLLKAVDAERMLDEVMLAGLLPAVRVAALVGVAALLILLTMALPEVRLTVADAFIRCKVRAAGIFTWTRRLYGHG
jgi:hypothetical protein